MSKEFDRDLEAVFGDRAKGFSSELRELLGELWHQGELQGRQAERAELMPVELQGGELSECGNYWCTPLNRQMYVLEKTSSALEELLEGPGRSSLRRHPPARRFQDELLKELDRQILDDLVRKAGSQEPGPGFVIVPPRPGPPRVPPRRRPAWEDWTAAVTEMAMENSKKWRKELFGSWSNSPASLTAGASPSSVTASRSGGGSGKR